jgi:hypothetical protein
VICLAVRSELAYRFKRGVTRDAFPSAARLRRTFVFLKFALAEKLLAVVAEGAFSGFSFAGRFFLKGMGIARGLCERA